MAKLFEDLADLDKLIHEPARLAIMTALSACQSADFLYLQRLTGLTTGNLSSHMSKLEAAGLIRVEKSFVGRRPNTQVQITAEGKESIESYWQSMEKLRAQFQNWTPEGEA